MTTVKTISPKELNELRQSDTTIEVVDVRTPVEYRELHLEYARCVPLDQLDPHAVMQARAESQDNPLYILCRSGSRGQQACDKFRRAGFENVINIDGGTLACDKAGLPMIRGESAMSLERQVRIAAGSLVLVGATLGWLVHPGFVCLSAFVGAGLVFAGVTDTCAMGMLLAKMPWNRCNTESTSCSIR